MAIDFPASPTLNDTFSSGGVTYTWDGTVWVASGSAAFVQKSGDTVTGNLTLNADLTVDTDTLYVDSTNNRVGIGTTSPEARLEISEPSSSTTPAKIKLTNSGERSVTVGFDDHNASPNFSISSGDQSTKFLSIASNGDAGIGTDSPAVKFDVAGKVRASTGVLFGTDTAAANTLEDYEEGSWTPGIEGSSTAGSYTFTGNGAYTKVGNKVTVWGDLTDITTVSAGSGNLRVTGLPVTNAVGFRSVGSLMLDQWDLSPASYVDVVATVAISVDYMNPRIIRDSTTDISLGITAKSSNTADIAFCITYTAA